MTPTGFEQAKDTLENPHLPQKALQNPVQQGHAPGSTGPHAQGVAAAAQEAFDAALARAVEAWQRLPADAQAAALARLPADVQARVVVAILEAAGQAVG